MIRFAMSCLPSRSICLWSAVASSTLIALSLMWCSLARCASAAEAKHGPLTMEETLGAAVSGGSDDPIVPRAWPLANPSAKPYLWKIVVDNRKNTGGAWVMLAGIGTKDDVLRIREFLTKQLSGRLDARGDYNIYDVCRAVAILARRDVPGAAELLDEMLTFEYWKNAPFSLSRSDDKHVNWLNRTAPFVILLSGYVFAGGEDLKGKCEALAAECDDPNAALELRSRKLQDSIRQNAKEQGERADRGVTEQERHTLRSLFNGDLDNPGRRQVLEGDAAAAVRRVPMIQNRRTGEQLGEEDVGKIVKDADAAFASIQKSFREKDVAAFRQHVMTDGGKIPQESQFNRIEQFAAAIEQTIPWLDMADVAKPKRGKTTVERWTELNELPGGKTKEVEVTWVRYRLEGTQAVGKAVRAKIPLVDHPTVHKRDDALIVLLQKRDSTWYWNPFGW